MYDILSLAEFGKNFKKLKKRYKSITKDILEVKKILKKNPKSGIELGQGFYKTRIKNSDKNKGKSAGYRVISYFIDSDEVVYLVTIYDKSDSENIPIDQLEKIIKRELG